MNATNPQYNDILAQVPAFRYRMLDRLRMDCKYWLGNGNKHDKYLWAGNVKDHIDLMLDLYRSFSEDEKPEWLSIKQIKEFARQMGYNVE